MANISLDEIYSILDEAKDEADTCENRAHDARAAADEAQNEAQLAEDAAYECKGKLDTAMGYLEDLREEGIDPDDAMVFLNGLVASTNRLIEDAEIIRDHIFSRAKSWGITLVAGGQANEKVEQ